MRLKTKDSPAHSKSKKNEVFRLLNNSVAVLGLYDALMKADLNQLFSKNKAEILYTFLQIVQVDSYKTIRINILS